eukprot:gene1970-2655_t
MVLYEFNSGYFLLNSSPPPAIKAIRSMTNGKVASFSSEDVGSSSDEQLQRLSGAVHTVAHPPASPSADSKKPVPLQRLAPMRFINHEVRVKKLWEQPHGLPGIISPPMPSASLLTVGTHDPDATASVAGTAEAGGQRRSSSSSSPHGAKPVALEQHHAGELSLARVGVASVSAAGLMFFAGGEGPLGKLVSTVDIYNPKASARWTDRVDCYDAERNEWLKPLRLSVPRTKMGVVAVSHYVLFAGTKAFIAGGFWCDVGDCNGGFDRSNAVDIFDAATASWDTMKLTQARSNLAGIGLGGPAVLFAGGTARSRPSEFFQNPKCFQNCLAKDPARHGRAAENSDKNKILYPTVKRLLKYSNRPVGVRSYSVDVYIEACDKWVVAELSVSRACMEGTAMLEEGGTYLVAVGGGELRTKWNLPFNMGGHDYYSSRVDMLRVDTKMCTVTNLNTGREYGVKP